MGAPSPATSYVTAFRADDSPWVTYLCRLGHSMTLRASSPAPRICPDCLEPMLPKDEADQAILADRNARERWIAESDRVIAEAEERVRAARVSSLANGGRTGDAMTKDSKLDHKVDPVDLNKPNDQTLPNEREMADRAKQDRAVEAGRQAGIVGGGPRTHPPEDGSEAEGGTDENGKPKGKGSGAGLSHGR